MSVRYEKTDVSVSDTVRIAIVVFAIATVASLILLPLMWLLEARSAQEDPTPPPLARFEPGRQPPGPRLQARPFDAWRELRAAEREWLTSYAWVDREAGIVRMPVDEAMRLLLERGFPVRDDATPAPRSGTGATSEPALRPAGPAPGEGLH